MYRNVQKWSHIHTTFASVNLQLDKIGDILRNIPFVGQSKLINILYCHTKQMAYNDFILEEQGIHQPAVSSRIALKGKSYDVFIQR